MMERIVRTVVVAAAIVISVADAAAQQDISLGGGGADQIWRGTDANGRAGAWLDQGPLSSGDDRRDLVIGAPGTDVGKVYVIYGGPVRSGEQSLGTANVVITGTVTGDQFGYATAVGNIFNVEDTRQRALAVGAPATGGGRGRVYLFKGAFSASASLTTANAILEVRGLPGDRLGSAMAAADLNNDGYRELIIGAEGTDRVYIIYGSAALNSSVTVVRDLATQPADITISGRTGVDLGEVLTAGDVTGDGIYDLVLGSPADNTVYLLPGRSSGSFSSAMNVAGPDFQYFVGADPGDRAGASLRTADLDGDGRRDLIVAAPGGDGPLNDRTDAGEVYVLWGGAPLTSRSLAAADVVIYGADTGLASGTVLATGDINRDKPNDLVVLASRGSAGAGDLHIYYGRSRASMGDGLPDGRRLVDLARAGQISRRILGDPGAGPISAAEVFEVTGEGARDVIASVSAANGNTGAVYFTISPKLRISQNSLTVGVNADAMVTTRIVVTNPSAVWVTWRNSPNRSWFGTNPSDGVAEISRSATFNLVTSAVGLSRGTYTGTVTVSSTSPDLEMSLPIAVTMVVSHIRSRMDTPASGAQLTQPFELTGWSIELSSTSGTGVSAVQIVAYPQAGGDPIAVGTANYGLPRPDVAAAYGSHFANSGFRLMVSGLAPGAYRLAIASQSAASGLFVETPGVDVTIVRGRQNDITVFRPSTGYWYTLLGSTDFTDYRKHQWGDSSARPVGGDYDGDNVLDPAVYFPSMGRWYVLLSTTGFSNYFSKSWGGPNDTAVPADYDGDGKWDIGIFQPYSGRWYVTLSSTGFTNYWTRQWGAAGDVPVHADYDGDGRADVGVFRPSTGSWYVALSSTDYAEYWKWQWGDSASIPVPADYDGDRRVDVAIFQPGTGRWFVLESSTGYTTYSRTDWGTAGDVPVPSDYDGDGRADIAVLRDAAGTWYIRNVFNRAWGGPGDVPIYWRKP